MRKQDVRDDFHKLIDKFYDKDMLHTFYEVMEDYQSKKDSKWDITDELSPEQIKRLEKAIGQAKNGKTVPDSVARERIRKWFTK